MAHAVFVRDVDHRRNLVCRTLAYEIESLDIAARLVRGIARSYPEHGHNPATDTYWFRDGNGLHEIWARETR